jgi:hypothetical protein
MAGHWRGSIPGVLPVQSRRSQDFDDSSRLRRHPPLSHDWAGVQLWVPDLEKPGEHHGIYIVPGCELSAKEPDLGGQDVGPDLQVNESGQDAGGSWCEDGRYWVDVASIDRPRLVHLHEELRIVPVD